MKALKDIEQNLNSAFEAIFILLTIKSAIYLLIIYFLQKFKLPLSSFKLVTIMTPQ